MIVLHFIHSLSGGGAEKQLLNLCKESNCKVHVGYVEPPCHGEQYPPNVELHQLPSGSNYSLFVLFACAKLIICVRPAIIQTWTLRFDVLIGFVRLLVRFLWVIRESGSAEAKKSTPKTFLRLVMAKMADRVVANSLGGADYWRAHGFEEKTTIIHNGYDFSSLDDILASEAKSRTFTRGYLIFLGRLIPSKNISTVVRVLSDYLKRREVDLLLLGDGPEKEKVQAISEELEVQDHIHLLGFRRHSEAMALLSGARALVFLSLYEGTPNVVLEAMYMGVPVVLSDTPSHRSFFDSSVAHFVNVETLSSSQASSAIDSILKAVDPKKTNRAKEFATQWSARKMANQYMALYNQLVWGL